MKDNSIEAYVKYNYFHKEQKRALRKDAFAVQNLYYNKEKDYIVCPMGQKLTCIGDKKNKSDLGHVSIVTRYQEQNCDGCPLRCLCHKSKTDRIIEINCKLNEYKRKARERLLSEEEFSTGGDDVWNRKPSSDKSNTMHSSTGSD